MPTNPVSDQVRSSVHELLDEVSGPTAEVMALGIVAGAAQAFMEITTDGRRQATLRLLDALALDLEATLGALAN